MFSQELIDKLGKKLINSPYLSVMIVNKNYQIVWHNQRFADEFNEGQAIPKNLFPIHWLGKSASGLPTAKIDSHRQNLKRVFRFRR